MNSATQATHNANLQTVAASPAANDTATPEPTYSYCPRDRFVTVSDAEGTVPGSLDVPMYLFDDEAELCLGEEEGDVTHYGIPCARCKGGWDVTIYEVRSEGTDPALVPICDDCGATSDDEVTYIARVELPAREEIEPIDDYPGHRPFVPRKTFAGYYY